MGGFFTHTRGLLRSFAPAVPDAAGYAQRPLDIAHNPFESCTDAYNYYGIVTEDS